MLLCLCHTLVNKRYCKIAVELAIGDGLMLMVRGDLADRGHVRVGLHGEVAPVGAGVVETLGEQRDTRTNWQQVSSGEYAALVHEAFVQLRVHQGHRDEVDVVDQVGVLHSHLRNSQSHQLVPTRH